MEMRTCLVTGGSGFIGSHLVDALVRAGDRVVVIDKAEPIGLRKNANAEYVRLDVQDSDLEKVFERVRPNIVYHLAAHLHDRESVEKPIMNAMDNVVGLLNVCEAVRKSTKAKIVFSSSCAVYGEQESLPISEQCVPMPLTPYGITKKTGERYLHFYNRVYDIPFVAFRFGNVYGPRQNSSAESGVIGIFSANTLSGRDVIINNDGKTTRDYIFVEDVVDALVRAGTSDAIGIYNIGNGTQTTTKEIFDIVSRIAGSNKEPLWNPDQKDLVKYMALDATLAQEILGWRPGVSLEDGIAKTVAWYREHLQEL